MSKKNLDINVVARYNILMTMCQETTSALDRSALNWALNKLNELASYVAECEGVTQPETLFGLSKDTSPD